MIIRLLSDLDFPALLAIEEATQMVPWSEAAFKRCWEANFPGWAFEEDGKIVAFVLISLASGECHVLNLCVQPLNQRKGLGRQLMRYALTWAREQGAGIVYLEVRRSNHPAIELYRKMNFKQIGERKDYYPTPKGKEDAIIFARDLGLDGIID